MTLRLRLSLAFIFVVLAPLVVAAVIVERGVPNALDASAQMKFATEIISNISFEYEAAGNYPVITGNCLESRTNFGAFYGGELSFLGFDVPVIEEKQLFGKLGTLSRSGKACKD